MNAKTKATAFEKAIRVVKNDGLRHQARDAMKLLANCDQERAWQAIVEVITELDPTYPYPGATCASKMTTKEIALEAAKRATQNQ